MERYLKKERPSLLKNGNSLSWAENRLSRMLTFRWSHEMFWKSSRFVHLSVLVNNIFLSTQNDLIFSFLFFCYQLQLSQRTEPMFEEKGFKLCFCLFFKFGHDVFVRSRAVSIQTTNCSFSSLNSVWRRSKVNY